MTTTPYDTAVGTLSPTAAWKLADAVGSTTAADTTGHGYTLTRTGTGLAFGWAGPLPDYALTETAALMGSSAYLSTTVLPVANNPTAMTLIGWYYGIVTGDSLLSIGDPSTNQFGIGDSFEVLANGASQSINLVLPSQNQWHMIVGTISQSGGVLTMTPYVDGVQLGPVTLTTSGFTFNSNGTVTTKIGGNGSPLIAQCAIWTGVALTPAQVQTLYQAAIPSSTLVPKNFNVSLGGRNYTLADAEPFYREYRRQLEPLIRTQADTSNLPGEQSMDPNGLWRRSFEDWRDGAGQRYLDRNTSVDNAYWTSKGVDTLTTAWQATLLPATFVAGASGQTIPTSSMCIAGGYLYFLDGAGLYRTPISGLTPGTVPTFAAISGLPSTPTSICSDGFNVYAACGTSGIYISASSGTSAATYVTASIGTTNLIGYANGRLMLWSTVASASELYNITAPGSSLPTALETFDNPNTVVTSFTSGNNWLYFTISDGFTYGAVYGAQTSSDGTTLSPPVIQTELPAGETAQCALGYLGYLVVGTSLGLRVCQQGSTGVTVGTLIPIPSPVLCLAAYGAFVWFGWTNYDGTDTGVGKISLENFVVPGILPAYASDRMATVQGTVNSVAVLNGIVLFGVTGQGLYMDSNNLVTSGTIQSGYILFDLTDPKVPALIDVQQAGLFEYGSYQVSISTDGQPFVNVGTAGPQNTSITNSFVILSGSAGRFEVLLTLFADSGSPGNGPTITRWTLRCYPAPLRPRTWQLPLILDEAVGNASGQSKGFNPEVEVQAIEQMALTGVPVLYQEGSESFYVFVTDFSFIGREVTTTRNYFNGLGLVNIQELPLANVAPE